MTHAAPVLKLITPDTSNEDWLSAPASLEGTGVSLSLLTDLVLKHLSRSGDLKVAELSADLALPVPLIEPLLGFMRAERLVEVPRRGNFDADVAYVLTELGRSRAGDALRNCQYAGPAPVSLAEYVAQVTRQQTRQVVTEAALHNALGGAVLPAALIDKLGAAMNSKRPLFLYGPSGTGKTYLAEQLMKAIDGLVWVPHAIAIDGEIVQVYDPHVHHRADIGPEPRTLDRSRQPDARWVRCARPVVKLGGEFELSMMDLEFDSTLRYYKAPAQLKANNGILIFDDLGRQRSSAHQILNRWIVPLDRRVDYLSLHTGLTFEVPFDVQVIFSSNESPGSLDDPAFVRRLGYKIRLGALSEPEYRKVFERACVQAGVEHDAAVADYLVRTLHPEAGMPFYPAFPIDLVTKIRDRAVYEQRPAQLTQNALAWAWQLYFASEADSSNDETAAADSTVSSEVNK